MAFLSLNNSKIYDHVESFTVAMMTLLTIMECLCHRWSYLCLVYDSPCPVLLSSWMIYHRILTFVAIYKTDATTETETVCSVGASD